MKLTVLDRQSLFDVAVQAAGSAEAAFELAMLNGLSVTDELETGQELAPANSPEGRGLRNRGIADYYANRQLKPATGLTEDSLPGRIFDYTFDNSFN